MIRINITLTVSNTGTHITASVNGTSPIPHSTHFSHASPEEIVATTQVDITIPIINEPPSPINILEVFPKTLWKKNGNNAPTDIAQMSSIVALPAWKNIIPKAIQAIMQ